MRRRLAREEEDSDINLTPMLDIVFIMLIFFIVTASFVKEAGIDVKRQAAASAEKKGLASIFVAISDNDDIWIDRRVVDVRQVSANVKRLLAENPQASVVIQADRESRNGTLVQVLDQIKLAGVKDIAISAEEMD